MLRSVKDFRIWGRKEKNFFSRSFGVRSGFCTYWRWEWPGVEFDRAEVVLTWTGSDLRLNRLAKCPYWYLRDAGQSRAQAPDNSNATCRNFGRAGVFRMDCFWKPSVS